MIPYRVFGGVVGALGRGADRVGGDAPLLLLSNGYLAGTLGGALLADGILEARDGHVICLTERRTRQTQVHFTVSTTTAACVLLFFFSK